MPTKERTTEEPLMGPFPPYVLFILAGLALVLVILLIIIHVALIKQGTRRKCQHKKQIVEKVAAEPLTSMPEENVDSLTTALSVYSNALKRSPPVKSLKLTSRTCTPQSPPKRARLRWVGPVSQSTTLIAASTEAPPSPRSRLFKQDTSSFALSTTSKIESTTKTDMGESTMHSVTPLVTEIGQESVRSMTVRNE